MKNQNPYCRRYQTGLKRRLEKVLLATNLITRIQRHRYEILFKPYDKTLARKEPGCRSDKKIVAFWDVKGWTDSNKIIDEIMQAGTIFFCSHRPFKHTNKKTKITNQYHTSQRQKFTCKVPFGG